MVGPQILVVEDERIIAKDIQNRLKRLGYFVPGVVSSGEEGLKAADLMRPDLALIDIRLKGTIDGIELAQQLRDRFEIPVVFLTAYADGPTVERAKKAEPFGYLIKPFDERELQTTIEMALYNHRVGMKLRESEQWLAATLRCIGEGLIATDEKGLVRFVNPVAEALTGCEGRNALGKELKEVFELLEETTRAPMENPAAQVVRTGNQGERVAGVLVSKQGAERLVQANASPIRNPKGSVVGVVLAFWDITEQQRTHEALRAGEERYRDLFENANDMVFSLDLQGRFLAVNKAAERITGYAREELLGMNFADLAASAHRDRVHQLVGEGIQGHSRGRRLELEILPKHGDGRVLEVNSRPQLRQGQPEAIQAIARDITERKQSERRLAEQAQELARSNAELEQFAHIVSHDLQEPLRTVANCIELLATRYHGKLDLDADDFIGNALDGINRMMRLIRDLLAYASGSAGGRDFRPTDCETVLEGVLGNLRTSLQSSGATLTHDPLPSVSADATQLSQLFQNLISNAIKFAGASAPRIHVSCERQAQEWAFSVRDNGRGIQPQDRERIFMIFEPTQAGPGHPGAGIGLPICKRIAERHGGRIWVESQPGEGATFYFTIPAGSSQDGG